MNRRQTLLPLIPFLWLGLLVSLTGCQRNEPPEIRIGLLAPLSGDLADTTGARSVASAELAVREVNEAGGLEVNGRRHQIVLVMADDGDNPETAVSSAQRLINQENVVAIIGPPFSGPAIPVAAVAENAAIPMISPTSTNPETTAGKTYVFRTSFVDDFQALAMSRFTLEELQARRAAVLFDIARAYSRGLAEAYQQAFESAGGEIVAFESYTSDENEEFNTQLETILASNPEVLFLPNVTDDVLLQAEQARRLGINAILIGSDSWEGERMSDNPIFDTSYFSGHYCRDTSIERVRVFADAYRESYGREPNGLDALTYDSFGLLFATLQAQENIDPQSIRDGLYLINYTGVTGLIDFEENGDPSKSVAIWRIQNGSRACYKMVHP